MEHNNEQKAVYTRKDHLSYWLRWRIHTLCQPGLHNLGLYTKEEAIARLEEIKAIALAFELDLKDSEAEFIANIKTIYPNDND